MNNRNAQKDTAREIDLQAGGLLSIIDDAPAERINEVLKEIRRLTAKMQKQLKED